MCATVVEQHKSKVHYSDVENRPITAERRSHQFPPPSAHTQHHCVNLHHRVSEYDLLLLFININAAR